MVSIYKYSRLLYEERKKGRKIVCLKVIPCHENFTQVNCCCCTAREKEQKISEIPDLANPKLFINLPQGDIKRRSTESWATRLI